MNLLKQLLIATVVLLVVSCKDKNPQQETDNLFKFKDYINYTTSGIISIADPIQIGLANEVEGWDVNTEISDKVISISPSVKGKLSALNSRTMVFKPEENLKPDTEYSVTVSLSKIYPNVPSEYKKFNFKFKTIQPSFSLNTNSLQSYSKEWQYIEGVLKSADVLPIETVKNLVSATQKGKKLNIKWQEASLSARVYEFKIDSIRRFKDDSEIDISWSGKKHGIDNNGSAKKQIPGISNFTIIDVEVFQTPEQHLAINFSDPIKKQQNFKGLVAIENAKNLKYVVDGNVLKVYPDSRVIGNVKVDIFQGIKNTDNYKLKKTFSEQIAFEQQKPAVRLISSGVILPNSSNLKFNFQAVNLRAVDVRVIKIYENNVYNFYKRITLTELIDIISDVLGAELLKKQ